MIKITSATRWSLLTGTLLFGAGLVFHRPAAAVPAFAEQTGRNCAACHVGGYGPELTQFGREFKLGGYTLRTHASVPISAMAVAFSAVRWKLGLIASACWTNSWTAS